MCWICMTWKWYTLNTCFSYDYSSQPDRTSNILILLYGTATDKSAEPWPAHYQMGQPERICSCFIMSILHVAASTTAMLTTTLLILLHALFQGRLCLLLCLLQQVCGDQCVLELRFGTHPCHLELKVFILVVIVDEVDAERCCQPLSSGLQLLCETPQSLPVALI